MAWFTGRLGSPGLTVGLSDLQDVFQPELFYAAIFEYSFKLTDFIVQAEYHVNNKVSQSEN